MKIKWCVASILVFILCAGIQLHSQPTNSGQESFEATKAKAEKGDATAQMTLGCEYTFGERVKHDYAEAVKWFTKAAEQGNGIAQANLGSCYVNGEGVSKDYANAVKWYRKAADQGISCGEFGLAISYENGWGMTQDRAEAVKWYRKAADHGFVTAQINLGICYANGFGVTQDYTEAAKWYRKAADQGDVRAQANLGCSYRDGLGVPQNFVEAAKWFRKAADQGDASAQTSLAAFLCNGQGVTQDYTEAAKWNQKAANQGYATAQLNLGISYQMGWGVIQDYTEAAKWFRKSATQGDANAQFYLGVCYGGGQGVTQNDLEAYIWSSLAAAQIGKNASINRDIYASRMSREEIIEGQRRAAVFVPHKETAGSDNPISSANPTGTGTGFFITDDGYLISNYHVVKGAAKVRLLTGAGLIDATVVKVDAANDLALLKANAEGRRQNAETFRPLPIVASRMVKLGATVATVGFPSTGMQGFSPKLAKGEIASLAGIQDDPRYFQISVPVQHGNSGGALVDVHGNVVGIVAARLGVEIGKAVTSDELPENVNYAVKSSLLLSFLESVPDVDAKLKDPNTKDEAFEDVVKSAQDAAVLVLVY